MAEKIGNKKSRLWLNMFKTLLRLTQLTLPLHHK